MAVSVAPVLSLADLEQFDPQAPSREGERRFLCPLGGPCDGKPRDASHRSLSVDMQTGRWNCPRCGNAGCLRDFWEGSKRQEVGAFGRPKPSGRAFSSSPLRPAPAADPAPKPDAGEKVRRTLAAGGGPLPLAGSPGADFLNGRLLSVDLAAEAGVEFHPAWMGGPAVLYPLRNATGELVAVEGRYTDGRTDPKTRCVGSKSLGFFATPGAWESPVVALVEGPNDLLALATFGLPGIAVFGSVFTLPRGLAKKLFRKRVLIASDADEKGDACAPHWAAELESVAAKPVRFRPPVGKDWNDCLERDPALVAAAVSEWITPDHAPVRATPPPTRPEAPPVPKPPATAIPAAAPMAPSPFVDEWEAAPLPELPPEEREPTRPPVRPPYADEYRLPSRSEWPEDGPAPSFEEIRTARFCLEEWEPHRPLWQEASVNVNRPAEATGDALAALGMPTDLSGQENARAVTVAQMATLPAEGGTLGWEYLRTWVSATYLDTGLGVGHFEAKLSSRERSQLCAAWEAMAKEWRAFLHAPERSPAAVAHCEEALKLAEAVAELSRADPLEVGAMIRSTMQTYEENLAAKLREMEAGAETKGRKRKTRQAEPLEWSEETAGHIQWLETWQPPQEFFALCPHRIILDPALFQAQLMGEVAQGVKGPRARYGALQSDLKRLYSCFTGDGPYCEGAGGLDPAGESSAKTRKSVAQDVQ